VISFDRKSYNITTNLKPNQSPVILNIVESRPMEFIDDVILNSEHNHQRMLVDIRFKKDGVAKPLIVFIHGFKGYKDWGPFNSIADYFAENGMIFCKFNLSHNGTTVDQPNEITKPEIFGQNNFSIELDDLKVVIDYLHSSISRIPDNEVDLNELILIGYSRGGGLAILNASIDKRIKRLITWAAVSDLSNRWPEEILQQWKSTGVLHVFNSRTNESLPMYYQLVSNFERNIKQLDIPKSAKSMNIPWLICHGTDDETLPYSMAIDLKSWNMNAELYIMEGANHSFDASHTSTKIPEDFRELIVKTLKFILSD